MFDGNFAVFSRALNILAMDTPWRELNQSCDSILFWDTLIEQYYLLIERLYPEDVAIALYLVKNNNKLVCHMGCDICDSAHNLHRAYNIISGKLTRFLQIACSDLELSYACHEAIDKAKTILQILEPSTIYGEICERGPRHLILAKNGEKRPVLASRDWVGLGKWSDIIVGKVLDRLSDYWPDAKSRVAYMREAGRARRARDLGQVYVDVAERCMG